MRLSARKLVTDSDVLPSRSHHHQSGTCTRGGLRDQAIGAISAAPFIGTTCWQMSVQVYHISSLNLLKLVVSGGAIMVQVWCHNSCESGRCRVNNLERTNLEIRTQRHTGNVAYLSLPLLLITIISREGARRLHAFDIPFHPKPSRGLLITITALSR